MSNVVATILTGPFKDEEVLISGIAMIQTDVPFQLKRLQFPISLAFAIYQQSLELIFRAQWFRSTDGLLLTQTFIYFVFENQQNRQFLYLQRHFNNKTITYKQALCGFIRVVNFKKYCHQLGKVCRYEITRCLL